MSSSWSYQSAAVDLSIADTVLDAEDPLDLDAEDPFRDLDDTPLLCFEPSFERKAEEPAETLEVLTLISDLTRPYLRWESKFSEEVSNSSLSCGCLVSSCRMSCCLALSCLVYYLLSLVFLVVSSLLCLLSCLVSCVSHVLYFLIDTTLI